jgi:hypothetical protein
MNNVLRPDPPEHCYSACALVVAGAVERGVTQIGLHRPYFSDSSTPSLEAADQRYKEMMSEVRAYLHEMNMPDEVFQIMQSIGPNELKKISNEEARRLTLIGTDPAFEEAEFAASARRYGITSAEYRERRSTFNAYVVILKLLSLGLK